MSINSDKYDADRGMKLAKKLADFCIVSGIIAPSPSSDIRHGPEFHFGNAPIYCRPTRYYIQNGRLARKHPRAPQVA